MTTEPATADPEVPAGKAIKAAREVVYLLGLMDDLASLRPFLEDALGPARMVRSLEGRRDELQRLTDDQTAALAAREQAMAERETAAAHLVKTSVSDASTHSSQMIADAEARRDAALTAASAAETRQRRAEALTSEGVDAKRKERDALVAEIEQLTAQRNALLLDK